MQPKWAAGALATSNYAELRDFFGGIWQGCTGVRVSGAGRIAASVRCLDQGRTLR